MLVEQEEPEQERRHIRQSVEPPPGGEPQREELHRREQQRDDECAHPGKEEELCAETSQQVGDTARLPDNLPHVGAVEEEQLELLLIMQMMRIGQSEEEQDGHTEQERT